MAHHHHPPRLRRALALAALLAIAVPGGALAQVTQPDTVQAARAAEQYYGSYSSAQPLRAPAAPAPAVTDDSPSPSWTAAILVGAFLIVTAAGGGVLAGRASTRRGPRRSVTS